VKKEPLIKKEEKESDEEMDDEDVDEIFLDWRAKKTHLK
jgi:hypothetical protein